MTASPEMPIADAKVAARGAARVRRREAYVQAMEKAGAMDGEGAGEGAGEAVARLFLEAVAPRAGCVVSAYWPMGDELDVRPLLAALHDRGHPCCLPVVEAAGRPLVFRAWTPSTSLVPAPFGTSVPPDDAPVMTPGLLVVPLLAFDERGYRLGYGGGFYDRTLAALHAANNAHGVPALAVGVAFEGQRADDLPTDANDQRLDMLVTERRARSFA